MFHQRKVRLLAALLLSQSISGLGAQSNPDTIYLGELRVEPATAHSGGFQWFGRGDANKNARVEVAYRPAGGEKWLPALEGHRVPEEKIEGLPLLAGSILNLEPGTDYEARLRLSDPDGVEGEGDAERIFSFTTWTEPQAPENSIVRNVYPLDFEGEKTEPYTTTLQGSLRGGKDSGWQRGEPAGPGMTLLLHPGVYKAEPTDYRHPTAQHFTGSLYFESYDGTAEEPLIVKGSEEGEVIIDGNGAHVLMDLVGVGHIFFENITFRNCGIVFQFSDTRHLEPTEHITIRNCKFDDVRVVIYGGHPGNRRLWFSDNVMRGRQQAVVGSWGDFTSAAAIGLAGRGHVIAHNASFDFFDFFNNWGFFTGGSPAGRAEADANSAVDLYNNYCERTSDNAFGLFPGLNLRAFHNFVINHGDPALDSRNSVGPIYYYRNIVFNQRADRGFKTDGGINGLHGYHNTLTLYPANFDAYRNSHILNNLFLGYPHVVRGKLKPILQAYATQNTRLDYNAYIIPERSAFPEAKGSLFGFNQEPVETFEEFRQQSGLEENAVIVGFGDVFRSALNPHGLEPAPPHNISLIDAEKLNLQLASNSPAIDAGTVIPTINENFTGSAPDLGAYEAGVEPPHYGPRWSSAQPPTETSLGLAETAKSPQ